MSTLVEPVGPRDHVIGGPGARVTLVEYGDYECPYCGKAHRIVGEVLRRAGPVVRFAYRHFPVQRLHPNATLAAQAAEAAGAQGQFWAMHDTLFANQEALELDDLLGYAADLGLDVRRFAHEVELGIHLPHVRNDIRTGVKSAVNGTPTFFLNGARVDTGWELDSLWGAIEYTAIDPAHGSGGY